MTAPDRPTQVSTRAATALASLLLLVLLGVPAALRAAAGSASPPAVTEVAVADAGAPAAIRAAAPRAQPAVATAREPRAPEHLRRRAAAPARAPDRR